MSDIDFLWRFVGNLSLGGMPVASDPAAYRNDKTRVVRGKKKSKAINLRFYEVSEFPVPNHLQLLFVDCSNRIG